MDLQPRAKWLHHLLDMRPRGPQMPQLPAPPLAPPLCGVKSLSLDIPRKRAGPGRKSLRFRSAPGLPSYPRYPPWLRLNHD